MDADGELVCVKPFPSQPTHFWNDEDGIKYTKAYFSMFKGMVGGREGGREGDGGYLLVPSPSLGVWAHGDFCSISSETEGVFMLGRRSPPISSSSLSSLSSLSLSLSLLVMGP